MRYYLLTVNDKEDTTYIHLRNEWAEWLSSQAPLDNIPESLSQAYEQYCGVSVQESGMAHSYNGVISILADASEDSHIDGILGVIEWWDNDCQWGTEPPELVHIKGEYF